MHKILNVSFDHDLISSFHDLEQLNCHLQQYTKLSYTNKMSYRDLLSYSGLRRLAPVLTCFMIICFSWDKDRASRHRPSC